MDILRREFIYIWYYFIIQLEQVFFYWVVGMVMGSAVSVFGKERWILLLKRLERKS